MRVLSDPPPASRRSEITQEDRTLRIDYGYILAMMASDEESFYSAYIGLERSRVPAHQEARILPLEEAHEHLAATHGHPEDLIGLRVRIEYTGTNWGTGVARIVPGRDPQPVGNSLDIPSRGFRYAVAGGGSI